MDAVVEGYRLSVGSFPYALLVEMPAELERFARVPAADRFGVLTPLHVIDGYVTVDITERPVFIMLTNEYIVAPPEIIEVAEAPEVVQAAVAEPVEVHDVAVAYVDEAARQIVLPLVIVLILAAAALTAVILLRRKKT